MERAPRRSCSLQARVLILGLLITLLTPAAWAQILTGRVVGVTDGDTITVLDDQRVQHKIRLAGIDAPEKAQAFGQRSKAFLSLLVFSKSVVVETQKAAWQRRRSVRQRQTAGAGGVRSWWLLG